MNFYEMNELLEAKSWTFAKTMPGIPHQYISRDKWRDEVSFGYVVDYIRRHGRKERWRHYNHHYLYLSGYKYWTMGSPIPETLVINRARPEIATPYDDYAEEYDNLFWKKPYIDENRALFRLIRPQGRVLDIGCGTGLFVEWASHIKPESYTGIDPSARMIRQFGWKHPAYGPSLRASRFEDCWLRGFDTIVALFGVASYIKDSSRVREMLAPGGRAFLMYYGEDYEPVTYKRLGVQLFESRALPTTDSCSDFGNYTIEFIKNEQ